jgi:ABC-2 type transport system permease protein
LSACRCSGASFAAINGGARLHVRLIAFLVAVLVCFCPSRQASRCRPCPRILPRQYLSFDYHFNNLARGVIDTRNLVFYASIIAVSLQLAVHGLEQRRLT